ncbi:MAG TPA: acyl-CoA dehydrogenase family protein [Actinomycetota bacterium]|nr:acyl-CoA dehydrogenase family protein [Actinomycetota bacterium]
MPIDFEMDERVAFVRDYVHDFAKNTLRPLAREADEKGKLPVETIKQLGQFAGNRASITPEEGKPSAERPASIAAMMAVVGSEELAWGDPAVLLNIPGPGLAAPSIRASGTPEQQKKFLDDIFNVESDEPRFGALAVTEPQAGSDVSNVQTTAVRDGDEWILNGTKVFCTNGARSEIVVVNATVDKSLGRQGQKFFVVEKGTPGFKVGKLESKLGIRASETAELILDDCRIPFDNILGGEAALEPKGSGFKGTMKTFDSSRPSVAAMGLGIGRAAYEYARDWVARELPMTTNFPRKHAIEQKLGQMKRELGAARGLVWKAAWMADNKISNSKEASMAKAYAPQAALRACIGAIQIMGPEGYSKEHLVEKWYRDIKVYDIFEGTGQIQRVVISRKILGRLD